MKKIRVMVIDDSALMRQVICKILEQEPGIEIIGTAADPIIALDMMKNAWPDVITLDIEMPRMDGITFLKKIMREHPTPVVVCSSFTEKGAEITMDALASGAVSIITKPKTGIRQFILDAADDLVTAVHAAARANMHNINATAKAAPLPPRLAADAMRATRTAASPALAKTTEGIVAMGTSTGGTQALEVVLCMLPAECPGILVVQHMPEKFTEMFAARLNSRCQVEVREACDGDRVTPGLVLIAPGGKHMLLRRSGNQYTVTVSDGPLVNRHKPSVDVLFHSVAKAAGKNALGIIMTGMGDDGARGLYEMHQAGAKTIAQDQATCVVYGMPKEAVKLGGVDKTLPLEMIANEILAFK
ncbi:MAG TPA: chemotaxis response regulator protein-glutamate methylesterase [Rhodocyclaceae bacterium]|nr:chemotaxis response regulator protein-glutamate methylesterase [Rhodocyclaceae bacterium]